MRIASVACFRLVAVRNRGILHSDFLVTVFLCFVVTSSCCRACFLRLLALLLRRVGVARRFLLSPVCGRSSSRACSFIARIAIGASIQHGRVRAGSDRARRRGLRADSVRDRLRLPEERARLLGACCEDVASALSDQHRVLELRGLLAILSVAETNRSAEQEVHTSESNGAIAQCAHRSGRSPVIRPGDIFPDTRIDHRLDCEDHARLEHTHCLVTCDLSAFEQNQRASGKLKSCNKKINRFAAWQKSAQQELQALTRVVRNRGCGVEQCANAVAAVRAHHRETEQQARAERAKSESCCARTLLC